MVGILIRTPPTDLQHFAMSMGRCGLDFRPLLPSIFERVVVSQLAKRLEAPVSEFRLGLTSMPLAQHALVTARPSYDPPDFDSAVTGVQVPLSLTAHSALAQLSNGMLLALNELRE